MKRSADIVISRACGLGEQIEAKTRVDMDSDIFEQLQPLYQAIDKRLWQKNLWMNAHVQALKELPKGTYVGVIEAMDYLYGQRMIPDYLMKTLEEANKVPGPEEMKPAEEPSDAE